MPPLPPAPSVIRISFQFVIGLDQTAGSRLFFKYTGGAPDAADCVTLASNAKAAADTYFLPLMPASSAVNSATVTDLGSDTGAEGTSGTQEVGTRSGSELPAGTATLINYEIARRYRGGKPRTYFPFGCAPDLANASTWTTAFVDAVLTNVEAFIGEQIGATGGSTVISEHVNLSYYGPPNQIITNPVTGRARTVSTRRAAPIIDNVTAITVPTKPSSQRRRYQRR
jgi:hypothetical protein